MIVVKFIEMILIISLCLLTIPNVISQKCSSPSIDEENFKDQLFFNTVEILPKHKGIVVEFVMENTLTIYASGGSTKYMNVEFIEQTLRISTTLEFNNYELNEIDTFMTIELNFECIDGTRRLNFYQNIKVVNNYAPLFSKLSYEIKIPTPLPQGLDITMFIMNETISAIDYDLKFYQLEFSMSDTTLFSVESRKNATNKRYTAIITTKQQITKLNSSDYTFTLTATDSFDGNRKSSSVLVKVFSDPNVLNIDPPSFNKSLYTGLLMEDGSFEMETITPTYVENVEFVLEGDYAKYFKTQLIGQNELKLTIDKPLDANVLKLKFLTLSVVARKLADIDGIATILIEIDSKQQKAPSFEKVFYEGVLVEKDTTFMMEEIVLNNDTYMNDVVFKYFGKDYEMFTFTQTDSKIKVQLSEKFDITNVKNVNDLLFEIEATKPDHPSAKTVVLVRITKYVIIKPQFEKSTYIGHKPDIGELMLENIVIANETFDVSINVSLNGVDADLFEIKEQIGNVVQIGLKSAVLVTDKEFLQFVVVASKIGLEMKEFANILISVGQKNPTTKALSFSKSIYEGSVNKEMKLIVEKVMLNEDNLDDDVVIQLSGRNQQFFTFTKTINEIVLTLKDDVTLDQLPNIPTLLVSVDALSDKFTSASTNVVISLLIETDSNLKFQKSLYIGSVNNLKQLMLESLFIESNNDINFHIEINGEDKDLFSVDMKDNLITISLKDNITEDLWNSRIILIINVTASFDGIKIETIVVITLPKKSIDKLLLFEKPSYIGSIDLNTIMELELIVLELDNYNNLVTFVLSGKNSEFFELHVDRNSINLQLKDGITIKDLQNIVLVSLEIKAQRDNYITGLTVVFLQLPWKIEQINFLSFDQVNYRGMFDLKHVLHLDTLKLDATTFSSDVIVSLKGDDADAFTLTQNSNEIELINKPFIDLENQSFFNFYVEAVKFGTPKVYANVVIDVQKMKSLSFDSLIYVGKLNSDYTLNFELIPLNGDLSSSDVLFVLKNGDIDVFNVKRQTNDLIIFNTTQITDDKLVNKLFFSFYLEASMDTFYSTIALIIIEIPMANSSIPIDGCVDKSDPSQPFFETGAYSFTLQSDKLGSFGRVKAMIIDPKIGTIEYKLQLEDDYLSLRLLVNAESGHLILSDKLAVGLYTVTAVAFNTENNKIAYTKILITVEEVRICTEDVLTTVDKTLAIEVLPENVVYNAILPTVIGNCELEILSVKPSTLRELFTINKITHYLTSQPFDREDAIFTNDTIPQIQLKLYLNCAASVAATNAVIQKQNLILTDDILFSTNLMFLNIVIEDQNDNYPVFTHPPTKNFIVGYPEQKLADKLLPPNLMIVKAFDIDEGLNAKIKYSLNDNRYFAIDSETGVIIPSKECMSNVDEVNLIVTATDRNGALNGNAESFNLKVIKVRIDNLVVMSIEYKQLSDVELFLKNISLNVKMNLLPINYAAIPHYDEEQNGNQWRLDRIVLNLIEIFIKVYVYAFDVENVMELKTNAEIIEMLKVTNITGSYNFTEFTDDLLDCNLTGFIVALSLIGGLLIIVCTVAPLLWFLWLHPKIETQRRSSETSGQQFDEDFNNLPALSSPVMPVKTITLRDEDVMGIEIDGVTIDGSIAESPTNMSRLEEALGLILDLNEVPSPTDSIGSEKKKSNVRFNELVERIEVLADAEDAKVNESV